MTFNLRAKYEPSGDQPEAIEKLYAGLRDGAREQTLLGVTGSGKSVVGSSKIIIDHEGRSYSLPIGQFRSIFREELAEQEATQIKHLATEVRTPAWQTNSGHVGFETVAEISRHRYKGDLYTVTTACGRENTFTDSHNIYVLREGELQLLPSIEIEVGDCVPIPHILPAPNDGVEVFDLREWMPEDGYYVEVCNQHVRNRLMLTAQKRWRVKHANERVGLQSYRQAVATIEECGADRVGSLHRQATLPVMLTATPELLYFLGVYIAEGHASRGYIILSTADMEIVQALQVAAQQMGLGLRKRRKPCDYQINGQTLTQLMKTWVGTHAQNKHLPNFWPSLSNQQLAKLLSGLFAGDGWIEKGSVCLGTVSKELASDVQMALLRFGIQARVRTKRGSYQGRPHLSWIVAIYGYQARQVFAREIGFALPRKDRTLAKSLNKRVVVNTNVDIFPLNATACRQIMADYKITQLALAQELGVSRSLVSLYLSGRRKPSRVKAVRLFAIWLRYARRQADQARINQLTAWMYLANLMWSPIRSIQRQSVRDEIVYDLAVPSCQTFLSGDGGYFVHNTFTMANLVAKINRPTLVLSHNKTLAAQLYSEFKEFFPDNAVHYFVSYFDYYQPEAYIPRSDTYIEKDSAINEEIDRLRLAATSALLSRKDVLIVASVSCIYGIGSVEDFANMSIPVKVGEIKKRDKFLRLLTDIQYLRNDQNFQRGTFRVRGENIDVIPADGEEAYRIQFFGDTVESITKLTPLTGEVLDRPSEVTIFPAKHYVAPKEQIQKAMGQIRNEVAERVAWFKSQELYLEAQRIEQRVKYDLEILEQTGYVKGIENYSRYLTNREPGEQPATLLDYFPDDFLMMIDESHITVPQVRGMFNGDRARKEILVQHGFRLPSALDNRPLTFTEFDRHINQVVYVSATPADYELSRSSQVAEQIIRPTGLLDPEIEVRPVEHQVDDLIAEIRQRVKKGQRTLVTTLTKRMAEDLTEYLADIGVKVQYLHSEVHTLERTDILRDLRLGVYDVLVGINLLREGLDLPEVSLVAIIDADKEGFLRSEASLIQTIGRAARHVEGKVIMYADQVTGSMRVAIEETNRRREKQTVYNQVHGITPQGIQKAIAERIVEEREAELADVQALDLTKIPKDELKHLVKQLTEQMEMAAANLQFEKAAELRDQLAEIRDFQAGKEIRKK